MRAAAIAALLILALAPSSAPGQATAPAATGGWQAVSLPVGLSAANVSELAVHPSDAASLALATTSGIFISTDDGLTWSQSMVTPTIGIAYAPADGARLYAWGTSTFLRSTDGGSSWAAATRPPTLCGLSIALESANRLYARACAADSGPRLYRSDDGGSSWLTPTTTFTPTLTGLAVLPGGPLLNTDGSRAYRSANAGQTWAVTPIGAVLTGAVLAASPDGTAYLGSPSGLLRSTDGGQTWANSDIARPITPTLALPSGALLGRDTSGPIQLTSMGTAWEVSSASLPGTVRLVAQSAHDASRIYALTNNGLWRRTATTQSYHVSMPLITRSGSATPSGTPNEQAIAYLNQLRTLAGSAPLQPHPALVQAAQNHANYYLLNANDSSAWAYGFHGEVTGKPGFTGQWPWDRARSTQYPWGAVGEVITYVNNPVWAVDGWMAGTYHRVIALNPTLHYTGYGHGAAGGTVDVMDFGVGPINAGLWSPALPYPLVYPAAGQTHIPIWGVNEEPSVTTAGITIIGFPVSVQIGRGTTITVGSAELRNGRGQSLSLLPTPPHSGASGFYALIPDKPLDTSTTYTAHVTGAIDGVSFQRTWSFTTASCQ
jgi:uncharacterized protein YkwD/photosystem II stability/assembly factor-like uncharacterized protein